MEKEALLKMTDEELISERKKLKNSKILHATLIGFLAGVLIFGFGAWIMNPDKKVGFLIPMFFPALFIYKLLKGPKPHKILEEVLRERGLN